MDISYDKLDITFNSTVSGTTDQVDNNFTWKWLEGTIIILCTLAIIVNVIVFCILNMFRVCSSAILITLMTIILGIRITTEAVKLKDDSTNNAMDFLFHIRVTHDVEAYIFCLVLVILFFQWL